MGEGNNILSSLINIYKGSDLDVSGSGTFRLLMPLANGGGPMSNKKLNANGEK